MCDRVSNAGPRRSRWNGVLVTTQLWHYAPKLVAGMLDFLTYKGIPLAPYGIHSDLVTDRLSPIDDLNRTLFKATLIVCPNV